MAGNAEEVRAAYDAIAADYATTYPTTEPEAPLDLAMVDHFAGLLGEPGRTRVLDAGCGTGRMARYLTDRGCSVTGLDLSPGMLAMARRDHPDIDVRQGSVTALPYEDDAFDGVLLWYSTIHLTDEELPVALAEVARVVRPGGLVLLAFQVGDGPWDVAAACGSAGTTSPSCVTSAAPGRCSTRSRRLVSSARRGSSATRSVASSIRRPS